MKKIISVLFIVCLVFLTACSSDEKTSGEKKDSKKVKIGISGSNTPVWEYIKTLAKKEGIDIELVTFSDYVLPNNALAEGDLDANAFQTVTYFNDFKKKHNQDLTAVGTTIIAPMGIYSKKVKNVDELKDGDEVALPNDPTNLGRALLLLQKAKLITLKDGFDGHGGVEQITANPKNLKLTPVVAAQTPRALDDVAISVINNNVAVTAGFKPKKDAIYLEDGKNAKPYINIIATQTKNKDNATILEIVKIHQSEEVHKFIEETYDGSQIPVNEDVADLKDL